MTPQCKRLTALAKRLGLLGDGEITSLMSEDKRDRKVYGYYLDFIPLGVTVTKAAKALREMARRAKGKR